MDAKNFIKFREKSVEKLDDLLKTFCLTENFSRINRLLDVEETDIKKVVEFVISSFKGKKRKDGKNLATHSLQLFINAKYFKIKNKTLLKLILLHDILEDTEKTKGDLEKNFGNKLSNLVDLMTEKKELRKSLGKYESQRIFIDQLKKGGKTILITEALDRIDDISDMNYLFKGLSKNRNFTLNLIANKLAKCKVTIDILAENVIIRNKIINFFYKLYQYQIRSFKISQKLINKKIKRYINKPLTK